MKLNHFNFKPFGNSLLLTNDFGNHLFVSREDFRQILTKQIDIHSELGERLFENKMIYDDNNLTYSAWYKHELRNTKQHVNTATSLHIFVVTTACNMRCVYCQANNGQNHVAYHMTKDIAEKSVDIALQSPSRYLSFEFQGGEPLINFELIKHIVLYTEAHKGFHEINYNIVSNLTLINDEMLDFFSAFGFSISTSIDGHELVHNLNRPYLNGTGTFQEVVQAIRRIRECGIPLGAIQTTTRSSLHYPVEIVRTYAQLGFDSIFLRPLTPLGKATLNWDQIGYTAEEFIEFYIRALKEILRINKAGAQLREEHASIFLSRIYGKFVNYMELRSPCGAGIGQLAYYADGNIFTCDEGRMLHEMGDSTFCLGNVFHSTYRDVINNGVCKTVCAASILESIPSCCDCVYQSYCGTCPVVNYARNQDVIEKEPHGYRCKVYAGILDYLFQLIQKGDPDVASILDSWSK